MREAVASRTFGDQKLAFRIGRIPALRRSRRNGKNAQIAAIRRRVGEQVKSTLSGRSTRRLFTHLTRCWRVKLSLLGISPYFRFACANQCSSTITISQNIIRLKAVAPSTTAAMIGASSNGKPTGTVVTLGDPLSHQPSGVLGGENAG